jgi:ATP-binding cassette, subfamily F, member 3
MIRIDELSIRRGPRLLFEGSTLAIHPGQKIGVTGGNGSGKSSLFALILGEMAIDEGRLELPERWTIAHVAQETPALECSAIDLVMDGDRALRQLQQVLREAEEAEDGVKQGMLYAELEAIDGFNARNRAARLMQGLGFSVEQEEQRVESFSGGWRMRLNLAQALMARSDLLLLDEPTNHLDLDAVFWLEAWLKQYKGTLLLISHDRDVLDRVIDGTIHIEQQQMTLTPGNYSAFERIRAERLAQQQVAHQRQQREREHMHHFVERFRAKATKAKQVQSRIKALERMKEIAPAHVDSPFHFQFFQPQKNPHPLLTIEEAAAGYGETRILDHFSLTLNPGDRIALLGRNGAGKSTLMKLLSNAQTLLSGERNEAQALVVGYFAQHQLELLDLKASPMLHLQRNHPEATEQGLRNYLGGFGFNGERVFEPVGPFSGGEKARLVLALIIYQRPNLLLLDEPTNHLDLEMRHALTVALQAFEGALVVVSHDRYLLEGVADQFLLVADHCATPFAGDLNDYAAWLRSSEPRQKGGGPAEGAVTVSRNKQQRQLEAEQRRERVALKRKVSRLEGEIEKMEQQTAAIEERLSDAALYQEESREKLAQLIKERGQLEEGVEKRESDLLLLYEALENG